MAYNPSVEATALRAEWVETQRVIANLKAREPLGPLGLKMQAEAVEQSAELVVEMDAAVHRLR